MLNCCSEAEHRTNTEGSAVISIVSATATFQGLK